MKAKEQHISEEQRAYEEWRAELLSDPESRKIYEEELQQLRARHYGEGALKASSVRKIRRVAPSKVQDPRPSRSLRQAVRARKERDTQRKWWQKVVDGE